MLNAAPMGKSGDDSRRAVAIAVILQLCGAKIDPLAGVSAFQIPTDLCALCVALLVYIP